MPIFLALLAFVLAGEGVSMAADRAKPGDVLYPVKTTINEPLERMFAKSPDPAPDVRDAPASGASQEEVVPEDIVPVLPPPETVAPAVIETVPSVPAPALTPRLVPGVKPSIKGVPDDDDDNREEREGREYRRERERDREDE